MSPYRESPPGMPDAAEVKRQKCQHIKYRQATWWERRRDIAPGFPVNFVCLDCGKKLWW